MSNLEKAAKLLMPNPRWCELVHKGEGGNPCMYCEADAEAGAVRLADAGLLAPDLPEPDESMTFVPDGKGWLPGGPHGPSVWTAPGGHIAVQRIEPGDLTPDEARGVAHALLAAANYSEGKGNQE